MGDHSPVQLGDTALSGAWLTVWNAQKVSTAMLVLRTTQPVLQVSLTMLYSPWNGTTEVFSVTFSFLLVPYLVLRKASFASLLQK